MALGEPVYNTRNLSPIGIRSTDSPVRNESLNRMRYSSWHDVLVCLFVVFGATTPQWARASFLRSF